MARQLIDPSKYRIARVTHSGPNPHESSECPSKFPDCQGIKRCTSCNTPLYATHGRPFTADDDRNGNGLCQWCSEGQLCKNCGHAIKRSSAGTWVHRDGEMATCSHLDHDTSVCAEPER